MQPPPMLDRRICEHEEIDDAELSTELLDGALRGLTTINWVSASARILWSPILELSRRLATRRLRVLDIATGAGDVPIALSRKAQRHGLQLKIRAVDVSDRALQFASRRAAACGTKMDFSRFDATADELPRDYDIVMSSLFLHHLDDREAAQLLRKMAEATDHLVLINDLVRHPMGLALAHFAGSVLTRSPVVRVDAVRSVRAAFTLDEVRQMAAAAGLTGSIVSKRWPWRFLLLWQR